jgi:hypothetical protein
MNQMNRFGTFGACIAVALAAYAAIAFLAELGRPDYRTADVFQNRSPPVEGNMPLAGVAASISLDGDLLANYAATKAAEAFQRPALDAKNRTVQYKEAEDAATAALKVSPIRPALWLALGTLRAQSNDPVAPVLKMSYLSGSVPVELAFFRVQTATSTSAASDEEVRLLAQSDIRSVLADRSRFESPLIATYVQATPQGRSLLLEATKAIDPKFSETLRRY